MCGGTRAGRPRGACHNCHHRPGTPNLYVTMLAESTEGFMSKSQSKNIFRILEKRNFDAEYVRGGPPPLCLDAARNYIRYDNMQALADGLYKVQLDHETGKIRVLRIKERFTEPTSGGWSDILITMCFLNVSEDLIGFPVEIQFVHTQMMLVRQEMGAHKSYSNFRTSKEILEVAAGLPREALTSVLPSQEAEQGQRTLQVVETSLEAESGMSPEHDPKSCRVVAGSPSSSDEPIVTELQRGLDELRQRVRVLDESRVQGLDELRQEVAVLRGAQEQIHNVGTFPAEMFAVVDEPLVQEPCWSCARSPRRSSRLSPRSATPEGERRGNRKVRL